MRLRALDGLRGLAALAVLFHHALLTLPAVSRQFYEGGPATGVGAWFTYSPLHVGWIGEEAVLVFFVLSGVVVALPFLSTPPRMTWRGYYPSRLVRLYLPVAASVALAVAWYFLVPRDADVLDSLWIADHDHSVSALTVGMTAFLLLGTSMVNSPLWSLRWEMWFSLLLPLYVVAARWRRGRPALLAFLVVALIWAGMGPAVGGVFYLLTFGAGVAIAINLEQLRRLRITNGPGVALTALAAVALTWKWTAVGIGLDTAATAWRPVAVVGAVILIMLALAWQPAKWALERRSVQWLGLVSFSLYLVHEPIVVSLAHVVPHSAAAIIPVLAVLVCLPAAWLFYRFVEAPSHRLAKWLRTWADTTVPAALPRSPLRTPQSRNERD